MNDNYVTAATAARLKAAGFPQPEPAPGQGWYAHTGDILIDNCCDPDQDTLELHPKLLFTIFTK